MKQKMLQGFLTFNTDLRNPGFLPSNENLQTAEISSDMKIHNVCKLWTLRSCEKVKREEKWFIKDEGMMALECEI